MALPKDHIQTLWNTVKVAFCSSMNEAIRSAAIKTAAIATAATTAEEAAGTSSANPAAAVAAFKAKSYGADWPQKEAEKEYWWALLARLGIPRHNLAIYMAYHDKPLGIMGPILESWQCRNDSTISKLKTIVTELGYFEQAALLDIK